MFTSSSQFEPRVFDFIFLQGCAGYGPQFKKDAFVTIEKIKIFEKYFPEFHIIDGSNDSPFTQSDF